MKYEENYLNQGCVTNKWPFDQLKTSKTYKVKFLLKIKGNLLIYLKKKSASPY